MTDAGHDPHHVDPEILAMVQAVRDRFGLSGLRQASTLIDAEIVNVQAAMQAAFAEEQ